MEPALIILLLFTSVGFIAYQIANRKLVEEVHLPSEITGESGPPGLKPFNFKNIFRGPDGAAPKRQASSNKITGSGQFMLFKFFLAAAALLAALIVARAQPVILLLCAGSGFILPDIWRNNRVKKRRALIVKDLPLVIDLLNICVGAGLDFMVAVNRVIQEFKPCALIEEMKIMANEIQMGLSRRDALKNLAARINNPEISSFVRTLLQADRIGTPISEALKMQSEEIRLRWFQRGEEMALKAPIKLLFPLLIFILPVVLIIVAGPILLQFTRGGMVKF